MRKKIDLKKETLNLVRQIPRGKVSSYGAIAEALGRKSLARAVGNALNKNPRPVERPCHRIVHSDGRIGGYKLGVEEKIRLLKKEGIEVRGYKVVDFRKHFFKKFKTKQR